MPVENSSTFIDGAPFNAIGGYLKEKFGHKIIKLSLDGGFTCPNRDGSLSHGGCLFCSEKGSGDFAGDTAASIHDQLEDQANRLRTKWPKGKYIAYFQKFTNTYGDVDRMRRLFYEALSYPDVIGIAIATRPDCLDEQVMDLLVELNQATFLWVELGLQTIHEKTAQLINRCYPLSTFDQALENLDCHHIKTVVHLILGLPGETRQDMMDSATYLSRLPIFGIKLQLLHIIKGTRLGDIYTAEMAAQQQNDKVALCEDLTLAGYIHLVTDMLEILSPVITIHRLTGDAPRTLLLAPLWSVNKTAILNGIQQEFKRRASYQGRLFNSASSYLVSSSRPSL
jgi:hypothetical protein